ncbi:hypothetical protein BpHYR1_036154 [Brachionus plicatilis]|uniref:Uncharacterized protein n=1 Tax=Brachionus plicatilis TaxID=10195 RepID=A0A3M7STG7_BRAPC|nr:hypothetical protein BpHYR1_036154 [Brachionus plicatilis]
MDGMKVADWSKARAERITTINQEKNEQIEIDNVNIKKFDKEPVIEYKELLDAYDWNDCEYYIFQENKVNNFFNALKQHHGMISTL